jgi:hypothetical protein
MWYRLFLQMEFPQQPSFMYQRRIGHPWVVIASQRQPSTTDVEH